MAKKVSGFQPAPKSETSTRGEAAVKAATSTSGTIEYSPYSVFPVGLIFRVPPVDNECFCWDPNLTFNVGRKEYTEQEGLYIYRMNEFTPTPVHFMGCFRNRPAISFGGDDDLTDQLLIRKVTFRKNGFTPEGVRIYTENTVPCTDFDDTNDINYLRLSKTVNNWTVIEKLAGGKWEVTHHVIAETRQFRKGMPPRQIFMNIPILKRIGEWDDQ